MHCPECGQEYTQGVSVCPECDVALTTIPPEAPPEPSAEWVELETILETSDPARLVVARSLLEAEGIPCFTRGELLQEFLGWGRMPSGFNLITGPVQLQVRGDRSVEARELLDAAFLEPPEDEPTEG